MGCRFDMFNVRLSYARVAGADRRYSLHRAWPPGPANRARSGRYLGPALALILPAAAAVGKAVAGEGGNGAAQHQLAALEVPGLPEVGSPHTALAARDVFLQSPCANVLPATYGAAVYVRADVHGVSSKGLV